MATLDKGEAPGVSPDASSQPSADDTNDVQSTATAIDFDGADDAIHRPGHPLEAEAAVLGAMLLNAEALDGCARRLEASDFVNEAHRTLFTVLVAMDRRGDDVDQVTVNAELVAARKVDEVGGLGAVWALTDPATCPTPSSWPTYATVVAREARRRRGIAKLERALERLRAGEDPEIVARDVGVNA